MPKAKATEQPIEKKQGAEQEDKRRRRRQIYQQYAAKFVGKSVYECDRLVVRQLMSELLTERGGQRLSDDEIGKVGSILLQGPVAQQLKQTQGKEAGVKYAMEVLAKAQKVVEKDGAVVVLCRPYLALRLFYNVEIAHLRSKDSLAFSSII